MNSIYLIGDSTCQYNDQSTYPQVGWGQVFSQYVNNNYQVINLAKNGRSSKSFIDEGLFDFVVKNIKKDDFLIIQFGHNDQKDDVNRHTDAFKEYIDNLLYFANTAKNVGATPIILSSIYRRHFDENGNIMDNVHFDYPDACKYLCQKENILYIDMCKLTKEYLSFIGEVKSRELYMYFDKNIYPNYIEGKQDNTHLRLRGAEAFTSILINELVKLNINITK